MMNSPVPYLRLRARWIMLLTLFSLLMAGCAVISTQEDIAALMKEGQALYQAKRYDEAIVKFRAVTSSDPAHWGAWLWTARSFIAKGSWADAIANARKAFDTAPQSAEVLPVFLEALFGGGSQALAGGNFLESIKYFSEYLKLQPANARAWAGVGKAYLGNKQFADALQALLRALGTTGVDRGDVIGTLLSGGVQAFNQRDYGNAITLLREYVNQDQRNLQAYLTLAKAYWESGQRGSALDAFRDVLRVSPTNPEALKFLRQMM
ncbi:MAG: tetratricopeptide repeat protein [Burkholderiales bacterium]